MKFAIDIGIIKKNDGSEEEFSKSETEALKNPVHIIGMRAIIKSPTAPINTI